ncbi:uncharacterized protein LTR77_002471 [Saxophila tyrrhenica]|uniref:PXA domain-containing protein n=1 Tax=Saxophila tyrrhenica TaxID=1690608 RepID=A0AAV9PM44_9PEZI|nr:hypothetical protein LTR77_002471 [Saxophila tyrrhenica]
MAQGDGRPRHHRQPSRLMRLMSAEKNKNTVKEPSYSSNGPDQETINYIKHVLCASLEQRDGRSEKSVPEANKKPLEELLPPLTSSNAVDVQLYAIIAVILSQFVQAWYNRITPDQAFVAEIVQITAHCTRGLEGRIRHVDLEELLLDELPALLMAHVKTLRIAKSANSNNGSANTVRTIYQTMRPNKALTPLPEGDAAVLEQVDNEVAWSQLLVSRILPLVLPPEDLANPCLHVLVSEVFSEMIVRNALCGKASEPWIIWEGVTKLLNSLSRTQGQAADLQSSPAGRLEQFGLLSTRNASAGRDLHDAQRRWRLDAISQLFWSSLQVVVMGWLMVRFFVTALMHGSSIPIRRARSTADEEPKRVRTSAAEPAARPLPQHNTPKVYGERPVISMRVWPCISTTCCIEQRMPWVFGLASLSQWILLLGPGRLCDFDSILDRLMASQIHERLSRPDLLPSVLQAIRAALFPNNALAAARVPPTAAESAAMKRECAETIVNIIPAAIRQRFFATKDYDLMRQDVEDDLDLFADPYINKHLIISAVELIVARLFPELAESDMEE